MNVVTRFPPSPTGFLHIGRARTALFNYLFARHSGGQFLFRLEDTDKERSKKEFEQDMTEALSWLGLSYDNKTVWRQSERSEIYASHLKKLVDGGKAYVSKETEESYEEKTDYQSAKKKDAQKRSEVVRFRNPNKRITFTDLVRGEISFDTTELGDFVIAKSVKEPLYHLAVVIDDAEMGVTHVIRGEDGISNAPRQILLQEALGFTTPVYAHIPLILAPDRSKLSGRHGAISVREYRERGYFPEALINYLALLGWNPGIEREIFTLNELVEKFDLSKVQKGGAIFNEEKLRWMNKEYLKKAGVSSVVPHIPSELTSGRSPLQIQALAEMLLERISVYGDITAEFTAGEYDYLLKDPTYPREMLRWKKAKSEPKEHLESVLSLVEKISSEALTISGIKNAVFPYAEAKGKGDVLWPMRAALSGREQSPDPFTLTALLGKAAVMKRLRTAIDMLE